MEVVGLNFAQLLLEHPLVSEPILFRVFLIELQQIDISGQPGAFSSLSHHQPYCVGTITSSVTQVATQKALLIQSSYNVCLLDARCYAELYVSISCHSMWWAWLRYKNMRRISGHVRCSRLFYYCISWNSSDPDTKQARLLWLPMYFGSGDLEQIISDVLGQWSARSFHHHQRCQWVILFGSCCWSGMHCILHSTLPYLPNYQRVPRQPLPFCTKFIRPFYVFFSMQGNRKVTKTLKKRLELPVTHIVVRGVLSVPLKCGNFPTVSYF